MFLVDSTVWVDFFNGVAAPHVQRLEQALLDGEDICTCGVILTEVLQGIRDDRQFNTTRERFNELIFLPMLRPTFHHAAEMYRSLRKRGVTIRKPVDCMIAAVAIEHGIALLENDRDFQPLASHCNLRLMR